MVRDMSTPLSEETAADAQRPEALRVEHLTISYDREPVVADVSFIIPASKLVGIVGPNGAGKSTMIKAIVGAMQADHGDVWVMGEQGTGARKRITYVPQRGSVDWDFPVTVWDVVKQGRYGHLGLLGRLRKKDRQLIEESLEKVGMTEYVDRQIGELSGGQQQRVFLARALCQQGEVYLLDEPFTGVDARTESAIVDVLRALRDQGAAVLVVHHDLATVREYFDDILLLNKHLIAHGPTDEVFTRDNLETAYGGRLAIFDESMGAIE